MVRAPRNGDLSLSAPISGIPVIRDRAFVTTIEKCDACEVAIAGFDEPLRIEVNGVKDARTGHYREFRVEVKAPKAMRAKMKRAGLKLDRIVMP